MKASSQVFILSVRQSSGMRRFDLSSTIQVYSSNPLPFIPGLDSSVALIIPLLKLASSLGVLDVPDLKGLGIPTWMVSTNPIRLFRDSAHSLKILFASEGEAGCQ